MSKSKKKALTIIGVISLLIVIFALVFLLYDSPAKYVKNSDGSVYIKRDGEPILYYTDLFGRTFYDNNGKRNYVAVPDYIDPVTD